MCCQKSGKHKLLATDFAVKRLLPGVKVLVLQRVRAHSKSLLAHLALKLGSTFMSAHVHLNVVL